MQLITVNIWGGNVHNPLIKFIDKHKKTTDIFLFQEVFKSDRNVLTHSSHSNILEELIKLLPEFNYYFAPIMEGNDTKGKVDFPLKYGQATFTKKNINVIEQKDVFMHKKFNEVEYYPEGGINAPRNFIYTEIEKDGKKFLVINVHGFWEPAPKHDTPQRYKQSQIIIDFAKNEIYLP